MVRVYNVEGETAQLYDASLDQWFQAPPEQSEKEETNLETPQYHIPEPVCVGKPVRILE